MHRLIIHCKSHCVFLLVTVDRDCNLNWILRAEFPGAASVNTTCPRKASFFWKQLSPNITEKLWYNDWKLIILYFSPHNDTEFRLFSLFCRYKSINENTSQKYCSSIKFDTGGWEIWQDNGSFDLLEILHKCSLHYLCALGGCGLLLIFG